MASGKTLDARKKVAKPAGTTVNQITMNTVGKSKASPGKTLDARKKVAKPAPTSNWKPTLCGC